MRLAKRRPPSRRARLGAVPRRSPTCRRMTSTPCLAKQRKRDCGPRQGHWPPWLRGPTGGRRSGRDCSPRWATSKTVGTCGAWPMLPELGQAHPAKGRVDVSWTAPGQPARAPTGPGRVLVVATQLCPLAGRLGLPDRNQADPGGGITRAPHRQRRVLVDTLDISLRSISQGSTVAGRWSAA